MGDEVIGDVSSLQYSAALETPKNEAFVKAYRAKYSKVPFLPILRTRVWPRSVPRPIPNSSTHIPIAV